MQEGERSVEGVERSGCVEDGLRTQSVFQKIAIKSPLNGLRSAFIALMHSEMPFLAIEAV